MLKKFVVSTAILAATSFAVAQPTIDIVDLGGGTFDVNVSSLGGGSAWTAGGLAGTTSNGGSFVYAQDPNSGANLITEPGSDSNVTFVSLPTGQSAAKRFDDRRAPSIAGKFLGGTGDPTATAGEVDVAFFASPGTSAATGYVARVSVASGFAPGDVFATAGAAPAGTTVLASGSVTSTTDAFTDAAGAAITWTVYAIPEPATLALLALGGLAAFRRR
jgi:hypothetical protein